MPELPAYILLRLCPQPLIKSRTDSTWKNSFYLNMGFFLHIICKLINQILLKEILKQGKSSNRQEPAEEMKKMWHISKG